MKPESHYILARNNNAGAAQPWLGGFWPKRISWRIRLAAVSALVLPESYGANDFQMSAIP